MKLQKQVGAKIKKARKGKKLSQQNLSDKTEIDQKYISNIEKGKVNVTISTVERIAGVLNKKVIFDLK